MMFLKIKVLRHKVYRKLFLAQVIALLGTGLSTIALAQVAYHLSGNNAGRILGIALTLKMIAYIFGAPIMNRVFANVEAKKFLIWMDIIRLITLVSMAFVQSIWQVYVLVVIINLCASGFTPRFQTIIPSLFKNKQDYNQALILSSAAYNLESLLSPLLAALLFFILPFKMLFIINAFAFLGSALLICTVKFKLKKSDPRGFGCLYDYLMIPNLSKALMLTFISTLGGALVIVNTVVYVQGIYHQSASMMALAMGVFGSSALIATLFIPALTRFFSSTKIMILGSICCIFAFYLGALYFSFIMLFIICFILGIGSSLIETLVGAIITKNSPSGKHADYFTAYFSLSHVCWLFSYFLAGFLGSVLDPHYLFAIFLVTSVIILSGIGLHNYIASRKGKSKPSSVKSIA